MAPTALRAVLTVHDFDGPHRHPVFVLDWQFTRQEADDGYQPWARGTTRPRPAEWLALVAYAETFDFHGRRVEAGEIIVVSIRWLRFDVDQAARGSESL